ncbi:MAG: tyrosine-type recombinase/integrase, partial [Thiohalocapsa sp.]
CRDTVLSPYLLHHADSVGRAKRGSQIRDKTMSMAFADARDRSGLTWDRSPPSLHELRSLASRLYSKQGVDVRALLGHTTERMVATYQDSRGVDWVEVKGA